MTGTTNNNDSYEQKISNLDAGEIQRALQVFREKVDHRTAAHLNSCVHCGLCAESCHYYLSTGETESLPAFKLNLLMSVFRKHFTLMGRILPALNGAQPLDPRMAREWIDALYGRCTLCGRCSLNCSIGLDVSRIIRIGRTALASIGLVPPELQSTVLAALEKGNNMGIPKEEWLDTVGWLQEELAQEVGDSNAELPLDRQDAGILYTVNPREPKFFPLSLLATAKIFYAAGESWTLSSDYYDVTNYALFSGDDEIGGTLSGRLLTTAKKLGAATLVLGECGHGFNSNRWEAPDWLSASSGIDVTSIIQVIADYIRQGRISLDPSRITEPLTLHDPCNLVRLGGIVEDQRFILKRAVSNFVEMTPNREKNYCCGGGGGQLSMTRYADRRLKAGRIKADQIRKTGAKIIVAPCHNCIDQLSELNREYKLGVQVKTVSEIVADALVIPNR